MNSKGVSEVVGNLLVLLIIAVTVSIMLSYGYPIITSGQEKVKIRNVISAMVFTKEKLDVVSADVTPSTTLKFPPSGGSIAISKNYSIQIYINDTPLNYVPLNPGEIVYVSGDRKLSLELGGIWEKENNLDFMVYPPSVSKVDKYISIDIPVLSGSGSVGGYGIATILMKFIGSEAHSYQNSNLKIILKTDFPDAWSKYLTEEGFTVTQNGNCIIAKSFGNVSIAVHRVNILI